MSRPCGPCSDKRRNELDRCLLEMNISGETFRGISRKFGYSEDALSRHKAKHLAVALGDIKAAMEDAREKAIAEAKSRELEEIRGKAAGTIASRLELAGDFYEQLKILQECAAVSLEEAQGAGDHKTALLGVREVRGCMELRLKAECRITLQQSQRNSKKQPDLFERMKGLEEEYYQERLKELERVYEGKSLPSEMSEEVRNELLALGLAENPPTD